METRPTTNKPDKIARCIEGSSKYRSRHRLVSFSVNVGYNHSGGFDGAAFVKGRESHAPRELTAGFRTNDTATCVWRLVPGTWNNGSTFFW